MSCMEPNAYGNRPMKDPSDYISAGQFWDVYNYCMTHNLERDALLFRTMFESGKRVGEVVGKPAYSKRLKDGSIKHYAPVRGLRPMDIDLDKGALFFQLEKGRKIERPIEAAYVSKELCNLLLQYAQRWRIQQDARLFPIGTSRVRQIVPKRFAEAGVAILPGSEKDAHSHALRHGAALDMANSAKGGTPLDFKKIQRQLGHRRADTTMYYLDHVLGSEIQELSERRLERKNKPRQADLSKSCGNRKRPPPLLLPHKFGASFVLIGRPILHYNKLGKATIKEASHTAQFGRSKAQIWLKSFRGTTATDILNNGKDDLLALADTYAARFSVKLTAPRFFPDIEWLLTSKKLGKQVADSCDIAPRKEIAGALFKFDDATHPDMLEINQAPKKPPEIPTQHAKTLEYLLLEAPALLKQMVDALEVINRRVKELENMEVK